MSRNGLTLYLRWVSANALSELFGLGGTFAVGVLAFTSLGKLSGVAMVLVMFLIAVGSGVIEATVVGLLQWWAMHPWFPTILRRSWWQATLVGALLAYILGYLPSTIINLNQAVEEVSSVPATEPPQWMVLILAGGMGAVAGAVLSFVQWLVLRKAVIRAGWWIPANMLAWFIGMPLIFLGIDSAQKSLSLTGAILLMALVLLLTGTVVGGIHGLCLVRLSKHDRI